MEDIRDKLNRVLEVILIMLLGVMVLNVSWQVFQGMFWQIQVLLLMNWRAIL